MTAIGGRNRIMAWVVGLLCTAIVIALAVLALPLLPATAGWLSGIVAGPAASDDDEAEVVDAPHTGTPTACEHLYDVALTARLSAEPGAALTQSQDAPAMSASVVAALSPAVIVTCTWSADAGSVTSTLASVPPDAGAILAAALPAEGFECRDDAARIRCTREDGALRETVEAGGGLWLSTRADGWRPDDYENRTAAAAWG